MLPCPSGGYLYLLHTAKLLRRHDAQQSLLFLSSAAASVGVHVSRFVSKLQQSIQAK